MFAAADGEHEIGAGGGLQHGGEHQRGALRGLVDGAHGRHGAGEVLVQPTLQGGAAEAVARPLHHRNEGIAVAADLRRYVFVPRSTVDGEAQRHSPTVPREVNPDIADRELGRYDQAMRSKWFSFPNPVNETSARLVAAGVVAQAVAFLATGRVWVLVPLAYGFLARVLSGPRFSPLGQLVTRVVTPRINTEHRFVPGPPKRFAQGVGLVFSGGALLAWGAGANGFAYALIIGLVFAATLESVFAFCLGCVMFSGLMRVGVIPTDVCEECADVTRRLAAAIH
mgnify:FL=1